MKSLSSVGLGLSIVFGCLLLALVAELYYLLWWKRRLTNKEISDDHYSSPARELFFMFCLKKPSSSSLRHSQEQLCSSARMADNHSNSRKDLLVVKPFDDDGGGGENVVDDDETELMSRIHTISGPPPRFLFTIIEETREDLESELLDGKGGTAIGRGSLSDLLLTVEESTPYLTPLASPPFFTPPLTPMGYQFFDSSADAEFNKIVRSSSSSLSSPPPKFKFLQEAEEKLVRRSRMAGDRTGFDHQDCARTGAAAAKSPDYLKEEEEEEEEDGSFITIIVDKHKEIRELNHNHQLQQQQHNSKVLPLASPASTTEQKGSIFQ